MILYNVTCLVEDEIHDEWLEWMKQVHLPEVMATGKFISNKMYRIDPHEGGDSGTSYSVQYHLETRDHYVDYAQNFAPALKAKTLAKYGDRVMAFRTILEEI
ncbi:MAG: DUF4286 family protein [Flavobacteriales bacterium]|nr:DUF4286 family protein [Flavobacteriales bacterium]